jgi:hypothetical protein
LTLNKDKKGGGEMDFSQAVESFSQVPKVKGDPAPFREYIADALNQLHPGREVRAYADNVPKAEAGSKYGVDVVYVVGQTVCRLRLTWDALKLAVAPTSELRGVVVEQANGGVGTLSLAGVVSLRIYLPPALRLEEESDGLWLWASDLRPAASRAEFVAGWVSCVDSSKA